MNEPVSERSCSDEKDSITGFLNSTVPVFLTSGTPATATISSFLNLLSMYWGPNHFALAIPVSSLIVKVVILSLVFVVKTEISVILPNIVISF